MTTQGSATTELHSETDVLRTALLAIEDLGTVALLDVHPEDSQGRLLSRAFVYGGALVEITRIAKRALDGQTQCM